MALKDLTIPTMVGITRLWVDPSRERPLLMGLKRVVALLPDIESAHEGLLRYQKKASSATADVARLTAQTTELDARHDRKATGIDKVLLGISELTDDAEMAEQALAARKLLLPKGTLVVGFSYVDEGGQADLVEQSLTPEVKKFFKKTSVAGKPLTEWVDGWFSVARELRDVEVARIKLQGKVDGVSAGDVVRARNQWIRVVSMLRQLLDLETDLGDEDRQALLGPLEVAEAKAARKGSRGAGEEKTETATPAPVAGDAAPVATKPVAGEGEAAPKDKAPAPVA